MDDGEGRDMNDGEKQVVNGGQGRDVPFFASFEAEPDLAERAEEILSAELGR